MDDQETNRASGGTRFRKLRITFSAMCLIACMVVILLWVASYYTFATTDQFVVAGNLEMSLEFYQGRMALIFSTSPYPQGSIPMWLLDYPTLNGNKLPGIAGFAFLRSTIVGDVFMFPCWFPVLLAAVVVATTPKIEWSKRFSLRTLLIVTTLVAMVLGWAAYVLRQ